MQQHAERNFPEKAGAANQKDLAIVEDFSWRKLHVVAAARHEF